MVKTKAISEINERKQIYCKMKTRNTQSKEAKLHSMKENYFTMNLAHNFYKGRKIIHFVYDMKWRT